MDFREEYKKSAESLSPDKEAMERMKAAVMKKIAEEQSSGTAPAQGSPEPEIQPKKPLPLRRIAYVGGALAACAVITVSAFTFLPMINKANGMIEESSTAAAETAQPDTDGNMSYTTANSAAVPSTADISEDIFDDSGIAGTQESAAAAGEISPGDVINSLIPATRPEDKSDIAPNEVPDFDYSELPDNELPDNGAADSSISDADWSEIDELPAQPDSKDHENPATGPAFTEEVSWTEEVTDRGNPDTGIGYTAEVSGSEETASDTAFTDEAGITMESTTEVCDSTTDAALTYDSTYEYEYATEDAEEPAEPVLVFGKGWITYCGNRYYPASEVTAGSIRNPDVASFRNPTDGKNYHVKLSSDKKKLEIYSSDWKFLSGWARK